MGKIVGITGCLLIIGLDTIAGVLGIRAEAAQNQVKHLRLWIFECKEPSHEAFQLGFAAAVLLVLAHVLAHLLSGCNVCFGTEKASANRQLSLACLLFTWITMAGAMAMLVIGTMSNRKSRDSCGFTHHHFLSIGGIVCMVHGLFSVTYYVTATAAHTD
ncbi:protein VASCULATURE COMPLEXITY AND CONNECTIVITY-like [Apium graveolens]|uniref:protein VASCULATURE COMPLEXITY AND CONNECTIVITY-like n=1 Tax=Apium graveolens TaxID=4045 RepID=UPI003D7BC75B